jgi:hypothetical protein
MNKTIAKDEFDMNEVLDNLSEKEKIKRVSKLYTIEEILETLGYYDESMDEDDIKTIEASGENPQVIYQMAIINGNFEQAIAMNRYLPI